MRLRLILTTAALTMAPLTALAAETCGGRLTVAGQGEVRVAPDMAMISLGVTTQAPTAAQAMADNAAQAAKVIEAVKAGADGQGAVADEDIQTSGLNLSAVTVYEEGKAPRVTGYQAQNIVTLRLKELDQVGALLDRVVSSGANEVQGISFGRLDDQDARDEARTKAVAEARRRAEVLASAAGVTLGPVMAIRETDGYSPPAPIAQRARAMDMAAGAVPPVQTGQLSMTSAVEMELALPGAECPKD